MKLLTKYFTPPIEESLSFISDISLDRCAYIDDIDLINKLAEINEEPLLIINPTLEQLSIFRISKHLVFCYYTRPITRSDVDTLKLNTKAVSLIWNKEDAIYCKKHEVNFHLVFPVTSNKIKVTGDIRKGLTVFNRLSLIDEKKFSIFDDLIDKVVYAGLKTIYSKNDFNILSSIIKKTSITSAPILNTQESVADTELTFDFAKNIPIVSLFRLLNKKPSFICSDKFFSCVPSFFQDYENSITAKRNFVNESIDIASEKIIEYFNDHKSINNILENY